MGLSFDDRRSLEEATLSLHFASDGPSSNSITEMGSISHQDNDFDGSEDIQAMGSNGSTVQSNQITQTVLDSPLS